MLLHLWYRPFVAYGGTLIMITDWQEFDGGEFLERKMRPRVTLNTSGELYFGKTAYEALGMPEAVKLYFDVSGSRIGVKPVPRGEKTFQIVRPNQSKATYGHARAATFCKHYGIKPE